MLSIDVQCRRTGCPAGIITVSLIPVREEVWRELRHRLSQVPQSERQSRRSALLALGVISALALSACGGSSSGSKSGPKILTAIGSVGGTYTQNMSPFSPNVNLGTDGILYENLVYVNGVTGQETPMLATGHSWSADNLTLTFTIRQGVNWSDGKPFSAN